MDGVLLADVLVLEMFGALVGVPSIMGGRGYVSYSEGWTCLPEYTSAGFDRLACCAGGVAVVRGLIAANPEVVGMLMEAKPEEVGGGRVS